MEMKWVHADYRKGRHHFTSTYVDVKKVSWNEVKYGDVVWIEGNLVNGVPTAIYGRHRVIDPEKQVLSNGTRDFFERTDYLFMEIK